MQAFYNRNRENSQIFVLEEQLNIELEYFRALKKALARTYREAYPECDRAIEDWKGQDIVNFQEELILKVNGRISEKWFYTHIKTEQGKLPRIDILNMLSSYAGYRSWSDFVRQTKEADATDEQNNGPEIANVAPEKLNSTAGAGKVKKWIWLAASLVVIAVVVGFVLSNQATEKTVAEKYTFCFVDADTGAPLDGNGIEVVVLRKDQSPQRKSCDKQACFSTKVEEGTIKFVVSAPYYKQDTVVRKLEPGGDNEIVSLKPDDYALMLHYFSKSKVEDWKKRREQLSTMIADEAEILQVYGETQGMAIYNKTEFINKMTMPIESLKDIKILETKYNNNGQMLHIRFSQNQNEQP